MERTYTQFYNFNNYFTHSVISADMGCRKLERSMSPGRVAPLAPKKKGRGQNLEPDNIPTALSSLSLSTVTLKVGE